MELTTANGKPVWKVTADPHVMIRVKNILGKADARLIGTIYVHHSPEVCRDLLWFCERYPMTVTPLKAMQEGSDAYKKRLEAMERIQMPDYVPREFKLEIPARHYQAVAAEAYLTRGAQLLADHVGLGKSVTALAAMTDKRTLPTLVVVQAHLPRQWREYAAKFLPFASTHIIKGGPIYALPSADIYICTYHKLNKWAEVLKDVVKSVVFDEIQELRHDESAKYMAAQAIRSRCDYAQGLSATPIFNYGGEIFNVMEILSPGHIGTREEFYREWCEHKCLKNPEAFGAYLREQGLMIRRTRAEVGLELPPIQTIIETVEYTDKVLKDLDTVATELAHKILAANSDFHSKGEAAREFDMKLRQATGIAKAPFTAAFVKMLLEEGEKVVLCGWHRAVYDIWQEMLKDYRLVYFTGTESPNEKDASVKAFVKGDANVFVMSSRSGSGLDGLQEVCNIIVHGELDWSPAVHHQNTGRLARDGQQKSVFEYYLISDGGSDPTICDILGIKKAQSDGILDPNGSGLGTKQTDDAGRVKRLAEDYLRRKHHHEPAHHMDAATIR